MEWQYLDNQFYNVTKRNYKKALIISNYHDAALKTIMDASPDPDYATLYNRYHPLHLTLVTEYTNWKNAGGQQEGSTLNLDQLLGLMNGKLDNWDPRIQVVYAKTTPRYKTIFPDGRKPFQRSNKDTRIEAVNTLSENIGADAALATIKTEVDTYYTDLDTARDSQSGAKLGTKIGSGSVAGAVANAMIMQYRNLGFLINKLYETPNVILNLFDVQTIRERDQRIFTGTLNPLENEPVLIHTFLPDDEIRLKITGNAAANFYLATTPGGTNSAAVNVPANSEVTIPISTFTFPDPQVHRFLTAVNTSNTETIQYLVELY